MKKVEYTFCMSQFKPAIAGLAVLVIAVVAWTGWHCSQERGLGRNLSLAAVTQPAAGSINVKDKMLHPYWGNCSKCHVTTGAGKPISKVMAGAPISIKNKMPHKYWGNCLLCHKVIDGLQPGNRNLRARAAAANRLTARSLGLKIQQVTGAMMRELGLANEDGALVLEVTPGSAAAAAGLMNGDEIIRAGKTRVDTINDFNTALNRVKPGKNLKLNIYRGNKQRNLFLRVPKGLTQAAATTPMTQNQIETLAEQLGVPKTQQDVTRALQRQKQARAAAATAPMTQNQVETLAEQLGVPKTQQDVTRALQRQKQARAAAATAPMTQNQVETLAEQLGVPKTQQDVTRALQRQKQTATAANFNYGKVVVAASGPGIDYQVSSRFGASPYLILFDPSLNSYRIVANPNANDATGRGVQTGQYAVDLGASGVIAGNFSQNALHTLNSLRMNAYASVVGPVRDALSAYAAGTLVPTNTGLRPARPRQTPSPGGGTGKVVTIY